MHSKLIIKPYTSKWAEDFASEAKKIKEILGENCLEVHHIGSTSVPGLAAKPIIDIMPVVESLLLVDLKNLIMKNFGYAQKGEYGIPFRRFFQKGNPHRTHHIHIFEKDNPEIDRHLNFRNFLRQNANACKQYESLKKQLAQKYPDNREAYTSGKSNFINEINAKAGFKVSR